MSRKLCLVSVLWLIAAVLLAACGGTTPTAKPTKAQPPKVAAEPVDEDTETDPPRARSGVLDDISEELKLGIVRPRPPLLCRPPAPAELPAVEIDLTADDCYVLCLWGFPFDQVVHVELYDPSGQFVAGHEETRERGQPDVGLKVIQLSLGGLPAGDWVLAADSAGTSVRTPLHIAEPEHPVMSIALVGTGPFTTLDRCGAGRYARGDQIAIFGSGFPPSRTLPLAIYEWREDREAWHFYSLVYRQEVHTEDDGRFGVHKAVRALVPEGGRSYLATVVLDPSASDDAGPHANFLVKSGISTPSEGVILELAADGGAFSDAGLQQAVLAAVNRPNLSDYFDGAQVTFLFSSLWSAKDASGEPWNPDLARQLLVEAGYADGVEAEFIYPDGDVELEGIAQDMIRDLLQVGISAEASPRPRADLDSYIRTLAAAGEPVLWLVRR